MRKILVGVLLFSVSTVWAADENICPGRSSSQRATTPTDRFSVDATNGTITDKVTGLMWARCELGTTWSVLYNQCMVSSTYYFTWQDALTEASSKSTSYLGQSGWRLPNIKELTSIIEYKCINPSLNDTVFRGAAPYFVWSSSSNSGATNIWGVDFYSGLVKQQGNSSLGFVRLVRDAP